MADIESGCGPVCCPVTTTFCGAFGGAAGAICGAAGGALAGAMVYAVGLLGQHVLGQMGFQNEHGDVRDMVENASMGGALIVGSFAALGGLINGCLASCGDNN